MCVNVCSSFSCTVNFSEINKLGVLFKNITDFYLLKVSTLDAIEKAEHKHAKETCPHKENQIIL